jgi:hypothetical protein
LIQYPAKADYMFKDTKQFGLARHSGTFLLDAGVAKQRADKSSALAESRATCCLRSAKPMCLNVLAVWLVADIMAPLPTYLPLLT